MRRALCVLILAMLAAMLPGAAVLADGIAIDLNGKAIETNGDTGIPFMDPAGRVMVPLRVVAEQAGALVAYDAANRLARVSTEKAEVLVPVDRGFVVVNGVNKPNDAPAQIRNGRTYLPIRIVMEALGYTVDWDASATRVLISGQTSTGGPVEPAPATPAEVPAVNKAGNSSINLYNGGLITREGNWLYFVNFSDGERLWRVDVITGKANAISSRRAASVNVINGWAYYRQQNISGAWELVRAKGDGTAEDPIIHYNVTWLKVEGDTIYYYQTNPAGLYKRELSSLFSTKVLDTTMTGISLDKGFLYYAEPGDDAQLNVVKYWEVVGYDLKDLTKREIKRIRSDEAEPLAVVVSDELLYSNYDDAKTLYRLDMKSGIETKLTDQTTQNVTISEEAYYTIFPYSNNALHEMPYGETDLNRIGPAWNPGNYFNPSIQVSGDYVYYLEKLSSTNYRYTRINMKNYDMKQIARPEDFVEP